MQRFFMHLRNSIGFVPDQEGILAEDLAEARQHAIATIRAFLAEELKDGRIDLRGRIEITGEGKQAPIFVPFSEAVTVTVEDYPE